MKFITCRAGCRLGIGKHCTIVFVKAGKTYSVLYLNEEVEERSYDRRYI